MMNKGRKTTYKILNPKQIQMTKILNPKQYTDKQQDKGQASSITMLGCSVTKHLEIVQGGPGDYKSLCCYHYRETDAGPFAAIFALQADENLAHRAGIKTAGVIVYRMPSTGLELRNIATNNFFTGFGRGTSLSLINNNIRCISRVIIEPRFRGLGLASR